MGEVLEHLKQPLSALSEVHRVLKKNGKFICDIPNVYSFSRIIKYVLFKKEDLGDPTHVCFFTPASMLKFLEISGFSIDEVATDWKEPMPWLPKQLKIGLGSHLLIAATKK
jgi:ubiquinone/menaquinone biosynthesis C-methylase UbiE